MCKTEATYGKAIASYGTRRYQQHSVEMCKTEATYGKAIASYGGDISEINRHIMVDRPTKSIGSIDALQPNGRDSLGGIPRESLSGIHRESLADRASVGAGGGQRNSLKEWQDVVPQADVKSPKCGICFEARGADKLVTLRCGHPFCVDCIRDYVKFRLSERKTVMSCPFLPVNNCQESIPLALISQTGGEETVKKLLRFQTEKVLESNPNARWCIQPRCGSGFLCDPTIRMAVCPECKTALCFQCRLSYHEGPCVGIGDIENEIKLDPTAAPSIMRTCPNCSRPTELIGGCRNVTCICGHRYCWICLSPYPCPNACGQRYDIDQTQPLMRPLSDNEKRILYLKRILCCFTCVYLSPVWLLISCFKAITTKKSTFTQSYWACPVVALFELFVFPVALLVSVFFIPIGLTYILYCIFCPLFCIDSGLSYPLFRVYSPGDRDGEIQYLHPEMDIMTKYKGPLTPRMVALGRLCIAIVWFWISFWPAAALSLCLLPIQPLALVPITCFPSLKTSIPQKAIWIMNTFIIATGIGLFLHFGNQANLTVTLGVSVSIGILGLLIAIFTPTSDWAFLSPIWLGTLAPIAMQLGIKNPVNPETNPFTGPVPFPGPYLVVYQDWNGHITL
ncbi:hypothetical protein AAMO2058_001380900 [Amorphochlora amoebiformis]